MWGQGTLVEQSSSAVRVHWNQRDGEGKKGMKGLPGQQSHQPTLLYSQVENGRTQLVSNQLETSDYFSANFFLSNMFPFKI